MIKIAQFSRKNTKKSHFFAKIIQICAFFAFILCFYGCAKSTPVETIADSHIDHINQTLEYAATLEQTKDVVFLENELKSCQMGIVGLKQAYYGEISTCKAKTDYWRLSTLGLFIALLGAVLVIIKRYIKVF